jgi:heme A synthase
MKLDDDRETWRLISFYNLKFIKTSVCCGCVRVRINMCVCVYRKCIKKRNWGLKRNKEKKNVKQGVMLMLLAFWSILLGWIVVLCWLGRRRRRRHHNYKYLYILFCLFVCVCVCVGVLGFLSNQLYLPLIRKKRI